MHSSDRIIVALDFDHRAAADRVVDRLGEECRHYKVGLELLTAAGPDVVGELVARGKSVFLDLKLFEIPQSVAGAVHAAGELGVSLVTVHAMGGTGIMAAAVDAAREYPRLRVLALTVVTSMTGDDLADIGVTGAAARPGGDSRTAGGGPEPVAPSAVEAQVLRLARLADRAGCHGVVAAPREAGMLRGALGPGPLIVTPGVVPAGAAPGDHARPGTPRAAVEAGASQVVLGRSVTRAADPAQAFRRVRAELDARTETDAAPACTP